MKARPLVKRQSKKWLLDGETVYFIKNNKVFLLVKDHLSIPSCFSVLEFLEDVRTNNLGRWQKVS